MPVVEINASLIHHQKSEVILCKHPDYLTVCDGLGELHVQIYFNRMVGQEIHESNPYYTYEQLFSRYDLSGLVGKSIISAKQHFNYGQSQNAAVVTVPFEIWIRAYSFGTELVASDFRASDQILNLPDLGKIEIHSHANPTPGTWLVPSGGNLTGVLRERILTGNTLDTVAVSNRQVLKLPQARSAVWFKPMHTYIPSKLVVEYSDSPQVSMIGNLF